MNQRLTAAGAVAALVALVALAWLFGHAPNGRLALGAVLAMWVVFAVGAILVMRAPPRLSVGLVVGGAVVLQAVALAVPPQTSTDAYRYVWDGRVQAAGVNPYLHAPIDDELRELRDPFLFPPGGTCNDLPGHTDCPVINRPSAHTIYPPTAQLYFRVVDSLGTAVLARPGTLGVQTAAAGLALGTLALILLLLHRRGADPRRAVVWAWCPLVVVELGNNAHVDGLAVLLSVGALAILAQPRLPRALAVAGGAVLGLAFAAKYWPAVLLPAAVRRHPVLVLGGALVAGAAVYLPFLPGAGWGVAGYLPDYVAEEGGGGLGVIRLVIPMPAAAAVAAIVLLVTAGWAYRHAEPTAPWAVAAALVGVSLIVTTPAYPWYALMLPALVALGARPAWLILPPVMTFCYAYPGLGLDPSIATSAEEVRALLLLGCGVAIAVTAILARRPGTPDSHVSFSEPEKVAS